MTTYAVTVLGRDRPGIVAEATALLAGLRLNLEDSSMTLLRGRFAMTLICTDQGADEGADEGAGAGDGRGRDAVDAALAPLRADGTLTVAVDEVPPIAEPADTAPGSGAWVLTVHGGDRPGIVSALTASIAVAGGTITDLTTRLTAGPTTTTSGALYLLVAEFELPAGSDVDALRTAVTSAAGELGVSATVRPADPDDL